MSARPSLLRPVLFLFTFSLALSTSARAAEEAGAGGLVRAHQVRLSTRVSGHARQLTDGLIERVAKVFGAELTGEQKVLAFDLFHERTRFLAEQENTETELGTQIIWLRVAPKSGVTTLLKWMHQLVPGLNVMDPVAGDAEVMGKTIVGLKRDLRDPRQVIVMVDQEDLYRELPFEAVARVSLIDGAAYCASAVEGRL